MSWKSGFEILVETARLPHNPLDDRGFQQLDEGERVSITGNLDYEFMKGQVFKADFVTTVEDKSNSWCYARGASAPLKPSPIMEAT